MNPDISADEFVLPHYSVAFLLVKQGMQTVMDVVVGINSAAGADHAPGAKMNIPCAVENGKPADAEIGFLPRSGKGIGRDEEFAVMNVAVRSPQAFLQGVTKFIPGLGGCFKLHEYCLMSSQKSPTAVSESTLTCAVAFGAFQVSLRSLVCLAIILDDFLRVYYCLILHMFVIPNNILINNRMRRIDTSFSA
jgi:hypothetical protein